MKSIHDEWDMWKRLLSMLENQFGDNCEFILHDLTKDYSHTIVDIRNGHITGRNIGDCGSNLGLEVLRGNVEEGDRYNYVVYTRDGKILRSSTMFIKDDNDTIIGCLCVNLDITESVKLEGFLKRYNNYEIVEDTFSVNDSHSTASTPFKNKRISSPADQEIFANNISEVLEYLISQADKIAGKPVEQLSREEKIEFVRYLDQKGAFLVTKSSDKVCEHLKISRFTLYNYLDSIRKKNSDNENETSGE